MTSRSDVHRLHRIINAERSLEVCACGRGWPCELRFSPARRLVRRLRSLRVERRA